MKNKDGGIFYFKGSVPNSAKTQKKEICKWKNEYCKDCMDTDPFKTQNFCYVAVKLYYADNNTVCPQCGLGFLHMTQDQTFQCYNCDYSIDYSMVIKKQKNLVKPPDCGEYLLIGKNK